MERYEARLVIQLPASMKREIEESARIEGVTTSEWCRMAITTALEEGDPVLSALGAIETKIDALLDRIA